MYGLHYAAGYTLCLIKTKLPKSTPPLKDLQLCILDLLDKGGRRLVQQMIVKEQVKIRGFSEIQSCPKAIHTEV